MLVLMLQLRDLALLNNTFMGTLPESWGILTQVDIISSAFRPICSEQINSTSKHRYPVCCTQQNISATGLQIL